MTSTHPTAEQLDRYRRRAADPAELLDVDAHVAACDRCFGVVRSDADPEIDLATPHLTYEEMEAYVDGRVDAEERAIVDEHSTGCAMCRDEVRDLREMAEDRRSRPSGQPGLPVRHRYRWLAAAAVLILAALGAWMYFGSQAPPETTPVVVSPVVPPPEPAPEPEPRQPETVQTAIVLQKPAIVATLVRHEGVLRGSSAAAFRLLQPVGTVVLEDRPQFRWEAAPDAQSYEVAVADVESGSVAASGTSESTSWRADEPLRRGRTYSWQVTAHTADGISLIAPGPTAAETLFHVAKDVEPLPRDPLARGVALANRGVLDDAEQSLEQAAERGDARAGELLEEVRSWRTSSHGLPTETKGAQ